jgi:hypothetical protein
MDIAEPVNRRGTRRFVMDSEFADVPTGRLREGAPGMDNSTVSQALERSSRRVVLAWVSNECSSPGARMKPDHGNAQRSADIARCACRRDGRWPRWKSGFRNGEWA